MSQMKTCSTCQTEISKGAKACPNCGAKQKKPIFKKWWFWLIVAVAVAGIASSGSNNSTSNTNNNNDSNSVSSVKQEEIVYQDASANELVDALEANAMAASKSYKNTYLNLTGKLGNIDSDGRYFCLDSDDEWSFINIQCFMKKDEHKDYIATLAKGQNITVKVKVTDVGEVLGYSADLIDIVK